MIKFLTTPFLMFSILPLFLGLSISLSSSAQISDADRIQKFFNSNPSSGEKCVQIFYDKGPDNYWIGRTYALFTQNLLGHFPELQQIISPIEYYQPGWLDRCRASIYIGSHYDSKIPDSFYTDFLNTKKNVAWLGYNIWRKPELTQAFGHTYAFLSKLDNENLDYLARPTFYKNISYKGETFFRYGEWTKDLPKEFRSSFEMIALKPIDAIQTETQVLATATHNGSNDVRPYILRNKNKFYVADVVYSFMHEADRYLVFSDLLFDILDLPPRHETKKAMMRMEDVHPMVPLDNLYTFSNTLKQLNVPLYISIIPFYFDPNNTDFRKPSEEFVAASQKVEFVEWIHEVQQQGAKFIWHGVTHQYARIKNPHDGKSGADFEFWDAVHNKPVDKDSASWVLNRLYDGYYELNKIGVQPYIWLTPHYQASTLDNILFGRVMPWTIGRVIYYNFDWVNRPPGYSNDYWYTSTSEEQQKKRLQELSDIQYKITSPWWNGQIFPYEIYGDVHGQRILPENLGNSQPFENAHVIRPRSVQEIVADAKRNRVLRDVWASYFYHPFLFAPYNSGGRGQYQGDPSELIYLIQEIKALGYEFVDVESFAKSKVNLIRPEPLFEMELKK